MNIFVRELASSKIGGLKGSKNIKIEDNVGESIHIHLGFFRLEMSIADFERFSEEIRAAAQEVEDGDR